MADQQYVPTPDEIRERCAEIRAERRAAMREPADDDETASQDRRCRVSSDASDE